MIALAWPRLASAVGIKTDRFPAERGSFIDRRASGWGHMRFPGLSHTRGNTSNTCKLLFQCAETIGKDVAEWLQKPTMNAQLGTAGKLQEDEGKSTDTEAKDPADK